MSTQCVFAHKPEITLWDERRPVQIAALPASPSASTRPSQALLNRFPGVNPSLPTSPSWKGAAKKNTRSLHPTLRSILDAIPQAAATVQDIYDSKNAASPPLVLIQDVHLNAEAQTNIVRTLQELINTGQVGAVGVEGAFDVFELESFRTLDKSITKKAADSYLQHDLLAAPSYVGITSPVEPPLVVGVDDKTHYKANVAAYLSTRHVKDETLKEISHQQEAVSKQKRETLSPALRKLDDAQTAYHKGALGIGGFAKKLASLSETGKLDIELERYLAAYDLEKSLDFERVDHERRRVVEKLAAMLSEQETADLVSQTMAYRTGQLSYGDFYHGLKKLCRTKAVPLSDTPAFENYIRYVLLSDAINASQLFDSLEDLQQVTMGSLHPTPSEKELLDVSAQLQLAEKLVNFELTPKEWARYNRLKQGPTSPRLSLAPFEEFYWQADIRSRKMVEAILSAHTTHPQASIDDRKLPTVLVVGGFHAPEIAALLRERKISHLVVSPKITKVDTSNGSHYLSVFAREITPLDKLFEGEKLFVAPMAPNALQAATGFRFKAGIQARMDDTENVEVRMGAQAYRAYVKVFDEAANDVVTPSSRQRVNFALAANWGLVFQFAIPIARWLFPDSFAIAMGVWVVGMAAFARSQRITPKNISKEKILWLSLTGLYRALFVLLDYRIALVVIVLYHGLRDPAILIGRRMSSPHTAVGSFWRRARLTPTPLQEVYDRLGREKGEESDKVGNPNEPEIIGRGSVIDLETADVIKANQRFLFDQTHQADLDMSSLSDHEVTNLLLALMGSVERDLLLRSLDFSGSRRILNRRLAAQIYTARVDRNKATSAREVKPLVLNAAVLAGRSGLGHAATQAIIRTLQVTVGTNVSPLRIWWSWQRGVVIQARVSFIAHMKLLLTSWKEAVLGSDAIIGLDVDILLTEEGLQSEQGIATLAEVEKFLARSDKYGGVILSVRSTLPPGVPPPMEETKPLEERVRAVLRQKLTATAARKMIDGAHIVVMPQGFIKPMDIYDQGKEKLRYFAQANVPFRFYTPTPERFDLSGLSALIQVLSILSGGRIAPVSDLIKTARVFGIQA